MTSTLIRDELSLPIPTSYTLERDLTSNHGLLILHGFSDRAVAARKRLLGTEPIPGVTIFSPNGFFPAPVKKSDIFHEAYAWYFRDPKTGMQMISPEFGARALVNWVEKLKLQTNHWTVVGFSQGGFFAPYLVRAGLKVSKIIAVGAAFRPEAYENLPSVPVYAIHGQDDKIVPHHLSLESFEKIKEKGYGKEFHSIPNLGHTLNEEGRLLLRKIL